MRRILYIILIISCAQNLFGQIEFSNINDSTLKKEAINYLSSKLGKPFVNEHLMISKIQATETYMVAFDLKKKCNCNKNMIAVFFKLSIPQTARTIIVDTIRSSIINKNQILDCESDKENCEFLLDENEAILIAAKAGFIKNNPVYTVYFVSYGSEHIPTWVLMAPEKIIDKYRSEAPGMSINAKTGETKAFTKISQE
ncbi:MAG: hypothetical protein ACXVPU_02900 [Bacteroidia bacterium]